MSGIDSGLESFTSWHFQGPPVATDKSGSAQLSADALLPSVLCAIEMALMQIVAQSMEVPLCVAAATLCELSRGKGQEAQEREMPVTLAPAVHSHVTLNALLTRSEKLPLVEGEPRGPNAEAEAALQPKQRTCSVVKVKVGGDSPVLEQAARVRAIAAQARARHQRLRLDSNQCWTLAQVSLSSNSLSYVHTCM